MYFYGFGLDRSLWPRTCVQHTHVRQAVHPYFQSENGHIYAIIELLEGPKIPSNILECEPEDIFVDMNVVATFEDLNDDFTLLKFKPGP